VFNFTVIIVLVIFGIVMTVSLACFFILKINMDVVVGIVFFFVDIIWFDVWLWLWFMYSDKLVIMFSRSVSHSYLVFTSKFNNFILVDNAITICIVGQNICTLVAILFIIWSFSKLYQATSLPPEAKPDAVSPVEVSPGVPSATVKPAPAPVEKKPAALPAKPGKLISTGQNVPNLFID